MGVRADGAKELIAMTDGYLESSEAWAGLLRDCARRGVRAPVLAVGDGALDLEQHHPAGQDKGSLALWKCTRSHE